MTDNEFVNAEIAFRDQVISFKAVCDEFGVDASDRIADILVDAGFDHVDIQE